MKRGEVWRVRLPFASGHRPSGGPAHVDRGAARFPGALVVPPNGQNGLMVPSVALVFQLRALDKRDCQQCLGVLDSTILDDVLALIDQLVQ